VDAAGAVIGGIHAPTQKGSQSLERLPIIYRSVYRYLPLIYQLLASPDAMRADQKRPNDGRPIMRYDPMQGDQ